MLRQSLHIVMMTAISCSLIPADGFSWGWREHRLITKLACEKLPETLPAFVRTQQACEQQQWTSTYPDWQRHLGDESLALIRKPNHYFWVETVHKQLGSLTKLPLDRHSYLNGLDEKQIEVKQVGLLPYAMIEHYLELVSAWREYHYSKQRKWRDRTAIEALIVHQMGLLSHFVADGAQPLHLSKHYRGWKGENPKGYTTNKKVHYWVDSFAVQKKFVDQESLRMQLGKEQLMDWPLSTGSAMKRSKQRGLYSSKAMFSVMVSYLERNAKQVQPLYELEKRNPKFKKSTEERQEFFEARLARAALMLASLWQHAWKEGMSLPLSRSKKRKPHT